MDDYGVVAVKYDAHQTLINENTQEDISAILANGYRVDDARLTEPDNKPSAGGDTDRPIYKYGWKCNGVKHRGGTGCQRDAEKFMG